MSEKLTQEELDQIKGRHERALRLLRITPGMVLGPMDSDAAHSDRGKLLLEVKRLRQRVTAMLHGGDCK